MSPYLRSVSVIPIYSSYEGLGVKDNLSYEEVPIQILDRQAKKLRNKEVAFVKELCKNLSVEGETWETEADMNSNYPNLFDKSGYLFLLIMKIMTKN